MTEQETKCVNPNFASAFFVRDTVTYSEKILELNLKFMEQYALYSSHSLTIANRISKGISIPENEHNKREQLFDNFMGTFTLHYKLQQFIIDQKVDPDVQKFVED